MEFKLVRGVPERLEDYREIFHNSRLYDTYPTDSDQLSDQLHKAMADGDLYVTMSPKDEVVGIIYMARDSMAGLSCPNLLSVEKKCRGKGIGTDLMKIFIGVIGRERYPNMCIITGQFNAGVRRLYQSLGLQPRCLLHGAFCKGVSEWLFMRPSRKLA